VGKFPKTAAILQESQRNAREKHGFSVIAPLNRRCEPSGEADGVFPPALLADS